MLSDSVYKIGTRGSDLALFQAYAVKEKMASLGLRTEIVIINSIGDKDTTTPIYEMGIEGVFTKALDVALLEGKIDLAVHSCKDLPSTLARGLVLDAVLERADHRDAVVLSRGYSSLNLDDSIVIGTGSIRRRLQWLIRYPETRFDNLRGNVHTRLLRLDESDWSGAIMAKAALDRLNLDGHNYLTLDWMLPAAGQGAIAIVAEKKNKELRKRLKEINHEDTFRCIDIERQVLKNLQGGCSIPMAVLATMADESIQVQASLVRKDGRESIEVNEEFKPDQDSEYIGECVAGKMIEKGALIYLEDYKRD